MQGLGFSFVMLLVNAMIIVQAGQIRPVAESRNSLDILQRQRRQASSSSEVDVESVIEALSSMDQLDCGKRYLCELATLETAELNKEEKYTINAFKQGKSLVTKSVGRQVFDEAVKLGSEAKSMATCQTRYKLCDVGKTAVRELLKEVEGLDTETNLV